MRLLIACGLLAAALNGCGDNDAEPEPSSDGGNGLPDTATERDAPPPPENDSGAGEDAAVEIDVPPTIVDVPSPIDVRMVDVRPAMDTGGPRVDVPRPVDNGPPRVDVPRPVDSGPPRTDVPRPVDTGVIPVPVPGTVPAGAQCHDLLRRLGVRFTVAGATMGVVDPVTVTPPIEGVHYRYASWTATERPMLMDCRLGVALVRLGRELRSRWNIDDVQHLGIYNYRVIAGTTTLSQHARAMGIDFAGFRSTSGTRYMVLGDFVETSSSSCPLRASNAVDRVLKEVACWMYDSRTFNIILTPNYNAAHRNHYHVDLTAGSHFVGIERPEGVDPPHSPYWDFLIDDD